jgi:hypothetical protein
MGATAAATHAKYVFAMMDSKLVLQLCTCA